MKRFVLIAIAALVLALGVLATMPLYFSPDMVAQHIQERARLLTGRNVSLRDAPQITWRPFLGIEANNVVIEDPEAVEGAAPLLQVEKLRARLAIRSALLGRAVLTDYQLIRPRISVTVDTDGKVNWAFANGQVSELLKEVRRIREQTQAAETPDLSGLTAIPLGQLKIVDGALRYENNGTGDTETLSNIEMSIDWPDTASAAFVSGRSIWRDEAIDFTFGAAEPLSLLAGGFSSIAASFDSRAFELDISGEANMLSNLQLSGSVELAAPSVRRLWSVFGWTTTSGPTLADFSIEATLQATRSQIKLSEAQLSMDGNSGRGALQISGLQGEQPMISGTLAYGLLNLTPYSDAIRQEANLGNDGFAGLDMAELADLDLRVSADKVALSGAEASQFAAALTARNDEIQFDVGNAAILDGVLVGTAMLRRQGEGAAAEVSGTLTGFDAAEFSAALSTRGTQITGKADLEFELAALGDSVNELLANPSGSARIKVTDGAIEGIDLGALRTQATSETETLQWNGRTAFSAVNVELAVFRRNAWISRATLLAPDLSASARGQIDLGDGGMAVRLGIGAAAPNRGESDSNGIPAPLPVPDTNLVIGGSLANPLPSRDLRSADR